MGWPAILPFGTTPAWSRCRSLIAVVTAYGGLRVFLARQDGVRLLISAVAFGVAVSGMHYTAMDGMHFVFGGEGHMRMSADWRRRSRCCRWWWRCCAS